MLHVFKLTSLDVYRDGGSLSISYESNEGIEHTLLFGIKNKISSERKIVPTGFKEPVLQSLMKTACISAVTGVSSPKWEQEDRTVSWEAAESILFECAPFISEFETDYSWVYSKMVDVAKNKGARYETS